MPDRRWAPALVTLAVAVGLAGLWLAAPPMGTDLSAQVARADFFAAHGWAPVDVRWYGGVEPLGYSLVTPPLMAWFGPRPVGAAAAVVSTLALLFLFRRTAAPRPLLGAVLGAACFTGNLVSGRITFAVGIALGLLALTVLIMDFPRRVAGAPDQKVHDQRAGRAVLRYGGGGLLAALAAAASPVAGLFVGLAGVAAAAASAAGRYRWAGAALAAGAAVPIAVMAGLFGSGGWMNMSRSDLIHAAVASLAVAALVPVRVVRIGALLSAAGVVAAYLVHTPVGLNSTRLVTVFALPVVAGYARVPDRLRALLPARPAVWLVPVLVLLAWWQPPVLDEDLARIGHPTATGDYFAPLRAELARRAPTARVEVVPTVDYGESAYLGGTLLARGWLRQVDLARNPLFFDGTLTAGSYRRWLATHGVSYVALPAAEVSWVGRPEAELIRRGLPYLTAVWEHPEWTLYEVDGSAPVVEGPAELAAVSAGAVVVAATGPGEILLRVRWSRWLAVTGPGRACLAPSRGWTVVRVPRGGEYRVTGSLAAPGPRC